jgi:hypothetical protein
MDPYFMHKIGKNGEVISKKFDTKKLPVGWWDSPKAAKEAKNKPAVKKVDEVEDDNSTGTNQQLSETSGNTGRGSDTGIGDQLGCLEPVESDAKPVAKRWG